MNSRAAIPKKVVLSGATGFLGRPLARVLTERGHAVHAYRRASSNTRDLPANIRWHLLPEAIETPFAESPAPDAVIHCAARYGRKGETAAQMLEANTLLPLRLHDLGAQHGVPVFLNTDTVLDPALNAYALSKHQAVAWLRRGGDRPRILNLRLQHSYGPGDDPSKFIPAMIAQCAAHVAEIPLTDGRQRRDFLYVDDAVAAYLTLLENEEVCHGSGPGFVEFDIGSGEAVEVRRLVERIHALTGSRSELKFGAVPHRVGEPMLTQADVSALRALGWHPATTLDEGLRRTVAAACGSRGNAALNSET